MAPLMIMLFRAAIVVTKWGLVDLNELILDQHRGCIWID
jgi:hypothetical protein